MALVVAALATTATLLARADSQRKTERAVREGGIMDVTPWISRRRFGFGAGTQGQYGQNVAYAAPIVYPVLSGQVNNKPFAEKRQARQNDRPQLVYSEGLLDIGYVRRFQNTDGALAAIL